MNDTLGKWHFGSRSSRSRSSSANAHRGLRRRTAPALQHGLMPLPPAPAPRKRVGRAALFLGASQFLFVVNFLSEPRGPGRRRREPLGGQDARVDRPSPPPHHNFDEIPLVVNGPHEFSHPDVKGKDWVAQNEPISSATEPAALGAVGS